MSMDQAWADVPRVMGQGLADLETVLPSTRGITLFGELRRELTESGAAEQAISGTATGVATWAGRLAQAAQEQEHSFWERHVYLSPEKRAREAAEAERTARAAGAAGMAVANWAWVRGQKFLDRKDAEGSAERVYQLVAFAARAEDGTVNLPNQALLARMLDAFPLKEQARQRIAAKPVPSALGDLRGCRLDGQLREAVGRFVFHAGANTRGTDGASETAVAVMVRMGLSTSAGDALVRSAREEYLSERDTLTFHYAVLQAAVAGIGIHLHLPFEDIAAAARHVVEFNPYEQARAENRRILSQLLASGAQLAAVGGAGHPGPALGIAASAASKLLGRRTPAGQQEVHQALTAYQQTNQTTLRNMTLRLEI